MSWRQRLIDKRVPGRGWTYAGANIEGINNIGDAIKAVLTNSSSSVDDLIAGAKDLLQQPNLSDRDRQNFQSLLSHQDGLSVYLGQPQRSESFPPARYKPTKGNIGENAKRLTYMETPMEQQGLIEGMSDLKYENKKSGQRINPYFRNFTISLGTDPKKGEYVSYYKLWDYGNSKSDKDIGKHSSLIDIVTGGKPFEIYDRLYLDDYYGVNSAPKNEDYYGGYLPEITVYSDKNTVPTNVTDAVSRLKNLSKLHGKTLKQEPTKENTQWLTDELWQNKSGDELLDWAEANGFKQGGTLNYLKYFK